MKAKQEGHENISNDYQKSTEAYMNSAFNTSKNIVEALSVVADAINDLRNRVSVLENKVEQLGGTHD